MKPSSETVGARIVSNAGTGNRFAKHSRLLLLLAAGAVYLVLAVYQLGLPGLHYDEAKEAGVNAMELITGAPVTAFRDATVSLFGVQLPLMVQDYIGALNVYLAMPFLALSGIGVPNLRLLPVLIGLATLLLAERAASEWLATCAGISAPEGLDIAYKTPITNAGLVVAWLLAVSPSFVFWSRQGIFVTNLMQPFCLLCVWQGVRWMRNGRERYLLWAAFAGGLALYAKLLAVWVIGPFTLMALIWWAYGRMRGAYRVPVLTPWLILKAAMFFIVPLTPLVLFNVQTGGTFTHFLSNMGSSYYGVDNSALLVNLGVRTGQVVETLQGSQFWYLGAVYSNPLATWIAIVGIAAGLWLCPRCTVPPVLLSLFAVLFSVVTISDLFVTHYALLYPFFLASAAIAVDRIWAYKFSNIRVAQLARGAVALLLVVWMAGNALNTVRYHQALTLSGGLADHSDASYHLSYYLRYNGLGAPIVLDWGMEAPIRFLSQGAVRPIEIFGYENLDESDEAFRARLEQFIQNPDNVYLLHSPGYTVFHGRREAFLDAAVEHGYDVAKVEEFAQRDGQPLFEVWRVDAE